MVGAFIACVPMRDVPRKTVAGPPGTLLLRDSLFMDKTEVTNLDWQEYVYWLTLKYKRDYPEIVDKALPDTLVWRTLLAYSEPYVMNYYRHPAYAQFPVVGVTYRQAMDYCRWRSDRVEEAVNRGDNKQWKKYAGKKVTYRLPSPAEWAYAAAAGLDTTLYPFGYEEEADRFGVTKYHVKRPNVSTHYNTNKDLPVAALGGKPNKYGFYNLTGNVAEMTAEEGVAKGGSFTHTLHESRVSQVQYYSGPEKWLGFRCVALISEKK